MGLEKGLKRRHYRESRMAMLNWLVVDSVGGGASLGDKGGVRLD